MAALFGDEWLSFQHRSLHDFIVFDLGNAAVHGTGGRYGRGLPVPVPVKAPGTAFPSVVNFAMFLTRFSSVIEVYLPL